MAAENYVLLYLFPSAWKHENIESWLDKIDITHIKFYKKTDVL